MVGGIGIGREVWVLRKRPDLWLWGIQKKCDMWVIMENKGSYLPINSKSQIVTKIC